MQKLSKNGKWIGLSAVAIVGLIPSLEAAQGGSILVLLASFVVSSVFIWPKWKTLPVSLKSLHIGMALVALSALALVVQALVAGGEPSFPGWTDVLAPPGALAFWVGSILAIRARAAISQLGDVFDALTTALLPLAVVVFTSYSYFLGTDELLARAVNGWFVISDSVFLTLCLLLVYGSGNRSTGARWLGATGIAASTYGLLTTIGIANDSAWQGDLVRFIAFGVAFYAIAVHQDSYEEFASPGTRPQRYRWHPYPVTGLGLIVVSPWAEPMLVVGAFTIFVLLCAGRIAVNSFAATRLTQVTEVTGNLARQLTEADSLAMATSAGVATARGLLPGKRLSIRSSATATSVISGDHLQNEVTTVPSATGSTTVSVEGPIPQYLVVVFEQIADILDFSLPTIEERLRRIKQESTAAIREAEEAVEAGWQALNIDSLEVPLLVQNGRVMRAAPNAETMVGFNPVGHTVDEIPALNHPLAGVDTFEDPDNPGKWLEVSRRTDIDHSVLYTIRDVTESVRAARTDPITGLANQAAFDAQGVLENRTIAVLYLHDVDRVNEASGKAAGMALLQEISSLCKSAFRTGDIVWRGVGAKLIVSFENAAANEWLEGRRQLLSRPITIESSTFSPTITIGATKLEEPMAAASALLRADMALNEARLKSPQSTCWYSEELRQAAKRSWSIETAFVKALADPDKGGFGVVYQPLIRAGSLVPEACEALVRWNHPTLGRIGPDEFIPLAEDMGIVDEIDRFVLQTALRDLEQFHLFHPNFQIHVNLSPVGLNPQKLQLFSKALALHSTAQYIVVEITESSLGGQDLTALQHACNSIRETGVSLSLDDFGTGESNFDRISKLPLSEVKLSKHFAESGDAVMVESVVQTVNRLGMQTVAENVETEEQLEMLTEAGVDFLQGFFFSPPKPISDVLDWMIQHCDRPALQKEKPSVDPQTHTLDLN